MKLFLLLSATVAVSLANGTFRFGSFAKRAGHTNDFVAFSVGLTQDTSIAQNSSVIFDKVWVNSGGGYDNNTGVFTCPHSGVYVFIFHGLTTTAGSLSLDLYKNDQYQITGYAHNSADYASASNAVTLQLKDGDTVYIRGHGTSQLYGRSDEVYATFTGYILIPQNNGGLDAVIG